MELDPMTEHDLEEMIPGNKIDHLYGIDGPDENQYDHEDIAQCQEMINFMEVEKYRKLKDYLDPEGVER